MSKYLNELFERHKDVGNIKELTKQIKADHNLSRCLKDQREAEESIKIKKEIQRMLRDR